MILNGDKENSQLTYRVGLKYDLTENSMLYASVATGFKSGGFFNSPVPYDNSYKPEKLIAYTVGSKNRFYNNRWQVNAEGFYWDYRDKQETFLAYLASTGSSLLQTRNAGKVKLYGVDLSVSGLITSEDLITLEAEYLHSKYNQFSYFLKGTANVAVGACTLTTTTEDGVIGQVKDCSGNPLVRAPKFSGRLAYTHTQPMGEKGTLVFNAAMNYSDSYYAANDFSPLEHQPAYETYDASLTWQSPSTKWSVTGWGKNLSNKNYYTGGAGQTPALQDAFNALIAPPRTLGVRLRYKF